MSEHAGPSSERLRQLERLAHVAEAAKWVARLIRQWFPVKGEAWIFEGRENDPGVIPEVLNALFYFDRALYPPEPQSDRFVKQETPLPRASALAAGWLIGTPFIWRGVHLGVLGIMYSHERIMRLYGLTEYVSSEAPRGDCPLQWPDIAPVEPAVLVSLEKSASILEELVATLREAVLRLNPDQRERKRRARNRKPRARTNKAATFLLAALDDRTNANKTQVELAEYLKVSPSAICRAFRHPTYGRQILDRYSEYGIQPPTIRDL